MLEQKNKSRARMRVAVSAVLAIHFIGLMALLMQGCRKPGETEAKTSETIAPAFDTNAAPAVETNAPSTNTTYYVPPAPETNPPPVAPSAAQEYTIVKGDTFETIGKKFGVATKAIENANPGVVPTKMKIGQKIQVPAPTNSVSTLTAMAPAAAETSAGGEQTYKVKSGDTLTTIGKHFGVTVKALRSANNLTTDKIKVGDKLKIPAKTTTPTPVETTTPSGHASNSPKTL